MEGATPVASVTAATALVGVLGDPVRHSLSPAMHNAALRELGLDWVYLALPVTNSNLEAAVAGLEAIGCRGLNVTLPHKQAVAKLCRTLSPLAQRVGAVNTLVPLEGGGWHGTNTDVEGFLAPLRTEDWRGKPALVLGCGGSARAVVAGLIELGLDPITLAGRRREHLHAFAEDCLGWAPELHLVQWGGSMEPERPLPPALLATVCLVVNTTPVGMASETDPTSAKRCPLSPAELAILNPCCRVYDLIYTPRPTRLLQTASTRGCRTQDGLDMLVHQGAAALKLWSGAEQVPMASMRDAALQQLNAQSEGKADAT